MQASRARQATVAGGRRELRLVWSVAPRVLDCRRDPGQAVGLCSEFGPMTTTLPRFAFRRLLALAVLVSATAMAGANSRLALTTAEVRAAMARTHAVERGTVTLDERAKRDPRVMWFPLYFVFDHDGCLAGVYDFDNLSRLAVDCAVENPHFGDVFAGATMPAPSGSDALVLVAMPEALVASCDACQQADATIGAALARSGIHARVEHVDLQVF